MEAVYILILALGFDVIFGELPTAIHPVGWMGRTIAFLIKAGKGRSPAVQFLWGTVAILITIGLFAGAAYVILFYTSSLHIAWRVVIGAMVLKPGFSLKGLVSTGRLIRGLLTEDKLAEARFELRALVKRDTSRLDKGLMVSATVESVAENACDSFFAPLLVYLFLGVPGAIGYRVINTMDAMIGRHGEYEYLGKFAAKLDTIVNFIPARITAVIIVAASWLCRQKAAAAWRIMLRDRKKTESPNAGWTMSTMAGALDVRLEKVGYYRLGDSHSALTVKKIDDSLKIIMTASAIWAAVIILAEVIYHVAT
ncbi:MAG: cobalamin biosynthesis protein [Dehalococcoidia bacterium]|jgi:adenosylcobinamide-phosphate synthase